jgi:hypothetical protein
MRSFVVCLLASVALAACESTTANNASLTALEKSQAEWQHRSFHSYSFDYLRFGVGAADAHVVVTNDVVTSVIDASTGQPPQDAAAIPTIDALFTTAHTLAEQSHTHVDFEFDSQLGYPTHVTAYTLPANPGGGYQVIVSNLQAAQ